MQQRAVLVIHGSDWGWGELIPCLKSSSWIGDMQIAGDLDQAHLLIQTFQPDVVLCQPELDGVPVAPLIAELHNTMQQTCSVYLIGHAFDESLLDTFDDVRVDGLICWSDIPREAHRAFLTVLATGTMRVVSRAIDDTPWAPLYVRSSHEAIQLTDRERQLLRLKFQLSNPTQQELAAALGVSVPTIRRDLQSLYTAFDAVNEFELGVQAVLYGELP